MIFLRAFLCGGALCAICQLFIDLTKLTPARILVFSVITGAFLSAVGVYGPFKEFAGAGASVPLTGFGHLLISGVKKAFAEDGAIGIFTGALSACAPGLSAAMTFSFLDALVFRGKSK